MLTTASTTLIPLPTSTPVAIQYPCQVGTQHAKNRLLPTRRTFKRVPSAQEGDAALRFILRKYWGHSDFRGPQLDICRDVMRGCDVLVVAPTGLGKSVCFQVPALTAEYGITIVVSPLVALMQDQVLGLREKGVLADRLCEKVAQEEVDRVKRQLSMGHPELRLLYVTPEAIFSKRYEDGFSKAYRQKQLNRIVIDEAHVIDEWGSSFRPIYRRLGELRARFPDLPITALTASATPEVRQDIINVLKIKRNNFSQYVEPFNRKNLFYEVRYRGRGTGEEEEIPQKSVADDIVDFITKFRPEGMRANSKNGVKMGCVSGLVYCRSRVSVEEMASMLVQRGVSAKPFHATLSEYRKDEALRDWKSGKVECIVATIAFGMGVDQAHVRYVIHYDLPKSFEGFYQETGRAGRDGHMSRCILYYEREDAARLRSMVDKDIGGDDQGKSKTTTSVDVERAKRRAVNSFKTLQHYAESITTCRHVAICRYFGEKIDEPAETSIYCNGMCDICAEPQTVRMRAMVVTEDIPVASQVVVQDDYCETILRSSFDYPSTSALRPPDSMDVLHGPSSPLAGDQPLPASIVSSAVSPNPFVSVRAIVIPPSNDRSPLPDPAGPSEPIHRRRAGLTRPPQAVDETTARVAPLAFTTIPQPAKAGSGFQRPPRTMDQITNEGLHGLGGAIIMDGQPRSPDHAENKRKKRDAAFKDVRPVTGQGLSPMYNSSEPKRKKVTKGFQTPFKALDRVVGLGQVTGFETQETPTGPSRTRRTLTMEVAADETVHDQPTHGGQQGDRKVALAEIREALFKTLGSDAGELGDQVWVAWGRSEVGLKREEVLKRAAREIEAKLASIGDESPDPYTTLVSDTLSALKILRHRVGVEVVVTERYARLSQSQATTSSTATGGSGHGQVGNAADKVKRGGSVVRADKVVDSLMRVKRCVERVKRS